MSKIKLVVIALSMVCAAFAAVAKADTYLRGFQALKQKDYETALYFLSLFAANGDARANYNLGIMYREGLGVEQDDIEALTHFIAAAEDGHMLGNYAVGLAFCVGEEVLLMQMRLCLTSKKPHCLGMLYRQWK